MSNRLASLLALAAGIFLCLSLVHSRGAFAQEKDPLAVGKLSPQEVVRQPGDQSRGASTSRAQLQELL
jgi:hypothetical protein